MVNEYTGLNNLPIFINLGEIASIEQKKTFCLITLVSGLSLKVREPAAEIVLEIKSYDIEQLMNNMSMK